MIPAIDWRAVASGAALVLGVLVAVMVGAQVFDSTVGFDTGPNAVIAFYVVALAGNAGGGWLAATRRPDAALAHGLLAALSAYAVVAAFGVTLRLTTGNGPDAVALAFNGLMVAAAAILGTLVAERWPRSRP
ncbi:MAG: hypothetical protein AB1673_16700 [Actinomycetota bacterium]|jgi:hypothetical protein